MAAFLAGRSFASACATPVSTAGLCVHPGHIVGISSASCTQPLATLKTNKLSTLCINRFNGLASSRMLTYFIKCCDACQHRKLVLQGPGSTRPSRSCHLRFLHVDLAGYVMAPVRTSTGRQISFGNSSLTPLLSKLGWLSWLVPLPRWLTSLSLKEALIVAWVV